MPFKKIRDVDSTPILKAVFFKKSNETNSGSPIGHFKVLKMKSFVIPLPKMCDDALIATILWIPASGLKDLILIVPPSVLHCKR